MFDTSRFLRENFQNAGGIVAHCRAFGVEPPREGTAQQWLQRGSLTGEWLASLLLVLEIKHGKPVSVMRYIGAGDVFG